MAHTMQHGVVIEGATWHGVLALMARQQRLKRSASKVMSHFQCLDQ
jgi:hypothetical protein